MIRRLFILSTLLISYIVCDEVMVKGKPLEDLIKEIFNQNNGLDTNTNNGQSQMETTGYVPISEGGGNNNNNINNGLISGNVSENLANPCGFGKGECTAYYLCADGEIITDGEGLLDIRFGEEEGAPNQEVHPCKGLFQTCCVLRADEANIPVVEVPQTCGHRNTDGVGFRITGDNDNEAQFGEMPWMVAILKEEKALEQILNIYQCGGSLIHPYVVLTAAHCVSGKPANTLKIRAGEWDTQTKDEIFPHQDRQVDEVVIHETYYKGGLFDDVALLFLTTPVDLAENVNVACLPPQDFNFDNNRCFATGWGKDLFGKEGKYQVILKRVELPTVDQHTCQNILRTTRLGAHFKLNKSFICAGGERGKDTCKGDGGSPLVCPIPGTVNRYYQAGMVAWGIGCGDALPGVYVKVALFRNWIDNQMRLRNYDTSSYSA